MGAPTTYSAAVDTMFTLLATAWQTGATAIVGSVPAIRWQGNETATPPPANTYWARVSEQQVISDQYSLSGGNGQRLYNSQGLLYMQIFCPTTDPPSYTNGRLLANLVQNALRQRVADDSVWFTKQKIVPVGVSNSWYQFNVSAAYQFFELQ
jgi:hypothetical protein